MLVYIHNDVVDDDDNFGDKMSIFWLLKFQPF